MDGDTAKAKGRQTKPKITSNKKSDCKKKFNPNLFD